MYKVGILDKNRLERNFWSFEKLTQAAGMFVCLLLVNRYSCRYTVLSARGLVGRASRESTELVVDAVEALPPRLHKVSFFCSVQ